MTETQTMPTVTDVDPATLRSWLDSGEAILVDVREDFEHASERIEGAIAHPLSKFDPAQLRERCGDARVVFHCRTGKRSHDAASRFRHPGDERAFHLAGGIEAWKGAGLGVERPATAPRIDVMRQVQMAAGTMVLIGVILGVLVSPWFLTLSGFVGAGLLFAGLSGWCGLAMLIGRMPWNRVSLRSCATS